MRGCVRVRTHPPRCHGLIVDRVNHAKITDAVAVGAGEFSLEGFDVIAGAGVGLQGFEAAGEFSGERLVSAVVETRRFARELDLKHRFAPCATAWFGAP